MDDYEPSASLPSYALDSDWFDRSIYTDTSGKYIDFVLAFQEVQSNQKQAEAQNNYRQVFEEKLISQGLILERHDFTQSHDCMTSFVKVHAPFEVLAKMAEMNRLRVPIQERDLDDFMMPTKGRSVTKDGICLPGLNCYKVDEKYRPGHHPGYFTEYFSCHKINDYFCKDRDRFFSQTQRIRLTWDLIQHTKITTADINSEYWLQGHKSNTEVDINFLLSKNVYVAAYPLHDGDEIVDKSDPKRKPDGIWPLRPWLYEVWSRCGRFYKFQPLDQVRAYFGEKIAIYFGWLGFYTTMLLPLAICGLITFLYGLSTCFFDVPMLDACVSNFSQTIICRYCPSQTCTYKKLGDYCTYAVANALFSHNMTFFFAVITSLWATVFLEKWKRNQARLASRWDVIHLEREYQPPRPQYLLLAEEKRQNPVTREEEPHICRKMTLKHRLCSCGSVCMLICVLLGIIIAITIYQLVMVVIYYNLKWTWIEKMGGSATFTSITASFISVCTIMTLSYVYSYIAWSLTEYEYPRTETDFEKSYTYKMYVFQFVNYYATLIYLAFIKGYISGSPLFIHNLSDHCSPYGCTFSVATQLCTILFVKAAFNNMMEVVYPKMWTFYREMTGTRKAKASLQKKDRQSKTRCEKDFYLNPVPQLCLHNYYLEMVLQYGFVAMFGAVFPLAALFAYCNNLLETRIDAGSFVRTYRRPVPRAASDIGTWYNILGFISRLAVLTNAVLIAFTTDIVDRAMYQLKYTGFREMRGYMNWTLSVFNTSHWNDPSLLEDKLLGNVTTCRFKGYYNPPGVAKEYEYRPEWWEVMLAKVAFILIFVVVILTFHVLIKYWIPDTPYDVKIHTQRNVFLNRQRASAEKDIHVHEGRAEKSTTPLIEEKEVTQKMSYQLVDE